MLIEFFDGFVNFTGVNSQLLSEWQKCKPGTWGQNRQFATPSLGLKTQTDWCSHSRIKRW